MRGGWLRFDNEAAGPHQGEWLRRLRLEQANLRAAIGYVTRTRTAPRPASTWRESSTCTGRPGGCSTRPASRWSGLAQVTVRRSSESLAMAVAARFAVLQHDRIRARELVDEGNEVAGPSRTPVLSECCSSRPRCCRSGKAARPWPRNRPTGGGAVAGRGYLPGELLALFVAGVCHGFAGNSVEATARHRGCIGGADEVGERHMKALAVAGLGEQELAAGRLDEAIPVP